MKVSDFWGMFKKNSIALIEKRNISADYYEFTFSIPDALNWQAGEHGLFSMPGKKISGRKFRVFSVASVPEERELKIITKIVASSSSFKTELKNLQKGESIVLRGPFGWFKLQDQQTPVVLIAGGVGIAPIRALLKNLEQSNIRSVTLLYSSRDSFPFQEEIELLAVKDDNITVHYLNNREELNGALLQAVEKYGANAYYYISGAPSMNNEVKKLLKTHKIWGKRVIIDPFFGY